MTDRSETTLAIDIGGTKVAFAEVSGARVRNRRQIPTPRAGGGDALVEAIAGEVRSAGPSRLAVATTGIVSQGTLTALNPVTLPVEDHYPLVARLKSATGTDPLVINDAQAAAWGEYRFGAGQGCRSFMFVTVSTGVGGGLVLDDNLQVGTTGLAGHVGHMSVPGNSRTCGCGRTGCLETIASGTAIALRFSERKGREVSTPAVFEAASSGDSDAGDILDEAAAALAETFANIAAAVDVQRIAIGGGVGLAGGFLQRVNLHVASFPPIFQRPVVAAQAEGDAGLIGVADLVMKKNFNEK